MLVHSCHWVALEIYKTHCLIHTLGRGDAVASREISGVSADCKRNKDVYQSTHALQSFSSMVVPMTFL
jgi:hypothetical protein